jgi:hypothetical protein
MNRTVIPPDALNRFRHAASQFAGSVAPRASRLLTLKDDIAALRKRGVSYRAIVQGVKDGVGACRPFVDDLKLVNPKLNDEQRKALDALLCSPNTVSLFRGGAGTGKSFVLCELVDQIGQSGRRVVVLAPQRQQVVDMESADFPWPTTVPNFLQKSELPPGAVVVVDEAARSVAARCTSCCNRHANEMRGSFFPANRLGGFLPADVRAVWSGDLGHLHSV